MPRSYGITNAAPYASAPAVGAAGDKYWNTTDSSLYVSNGTTWVKVGPGAGGPPSGPATGGDLSGTYPSPTLLTVGAQVQSSTFPTILNATTTTVQFDTVIVNRGGAWSAGTPTRISLPQTGVYLVGGAMAWAPNATGSRILVLTNKAGATVARCDMGNFGSGANTAQNAQVLYVVTDPTDYLTLGVWHNAGTSLALQTAPPTLYAWRLAT